MKQTQKKPADAGPMGREFSAATLALALSGSAWAADWDLGASVTARETYTDNVALGAAGGAKSDWITEVTPTLTAKKTGARLKVDASYANQNLFYAQDSARNKTYHQLNARANAELLEKEFFLDTSAAISQVSISPLGATGTDNTSATGNVTSVRTVTVSPYWTHRFGSTATFNARYAISDVSNSSSTFSGSTNQSVNLSLGSGSAFGRVSWGVNFSDQTADYQNRPDVSFTTTSASLGYLFSARTRLTATLGVEESTYLSTGSAPKGSFWNITGSWAPSTRTTLDLGFGHHYYGDTWNMAFKTRGAHSEWTANYAESVTTSSNQFANSGYGFSFTEQGGLVDISTINQNTLTNQTYLNKRFDTGFHWKKGRSDVTLSAYHSMQTTQIDETRNTTMQSLVTGATTTTSDPLLVTSNIKQIGASGAWRWQLAPLISARLSVGINRSSYSDLGREDKTATAQIGLDRKFSPHLTGSLNLRRQARESDQNTADFTENALTGSVTYAF